MPKHYSNSGGTCDSIAYATHSKGKKYEPKMTDERKQGI